MSGWVYRAALDHVCDKPTSGSGAKVGDIWQCDCSKLWRVTRVNFDQRDNASWLEWAEWFGAVPAQKSGGTVRPHRLGEDSSGIYAPGTK